VVAYAILLIPNYFLAQKILRLEEHHHIDIKDKIVPVRLPLVLKYELGERATENPAVAKIIEQAGLSPGDAAALPSEHPELVDIEWVRRANPYPPLLYGYYSTGYHYGFVSFGYMGVDDDYHQITFYRGEADSTPSLFIPKTRGSQTGWGDYFIEYTVYLTSNSFKNSTRDTLASGKARELSSPLYPPDIDRIDWNTYEGGSYNGFEEIIMALIGPILELGLIAFFYMIYSAGYRRGSMRSAGLQDGSV